MAKIVHEFSIGKYKVLTLDGAKPNRDYRAYQIDGKTYKVVPVYDAENCIAIESSETFTGKTVEFV